MLGTAEIKRNSDVRALNVQRDGASHMTAGCLNAQIQNRPNTNMVMNMITNINMNTATNIIMNMIMSTITNIIMN